MHSTDAAAVACGHHKASKPSTAAAGSARAAPSNLKLYADGGWWCRSSIACSPPCRAASMPHLQGQWCTLIGPSRTQFQAYPAACNAGQAAYCIGASLGGRRGRTGSTGGALQEARSHLRQRRGLRQGGDHGPLPAPSPDRSLRHRRRLRPGVWNSSRIQVPGG